MTDTADTRSSGAPDATSSSGSMYEPTWWQAPDGRVALEHRWDATAGVRLTTGERWWGTAVQLRRAGTKRWHRFTLVDVHPLDYAAVRAAILAALEQGAVTV